MEVLIKLLILSLPLGVLLRINLFSSVYIYPSDILIILISLSFTISSIKNRLNVLRLPLSKEWLLFIVFGFIALLLNSYQLKGDQLLVSFLYGMRILLYSIPMFAILSLKINDLKKYLLFSGVLFVAFGLIQYIFYNDLRNLYYLQWDEHIYRLFSTFLDPNFTGAFLVLLLLLFISQLYVVKKRRVELSICVALTILSILLTYSRSTLVMLFISLIVFFTLINKRKLIIFVFLLIAGLYLLIPRDFRIENMNLFRTESIKGRQGSFSNALFIYDKSPLYGVGFNSYRYMQRKYGLLDIKFEVTHSGAGVSNSYLFVLVTTGIMGFVIFLYFWINVFKEVTRELKKDRYKNSMILASLVGIGVHSLFENTIFYPFIMIWVFILIGYSISKTK